MADQRNTTFREYRKGNWTVHETMILITAKKMDEERRMKRNNGGESSEGRSRPAELRWKWVEDYCWSNGCLRSQNQCNDKWDNLMRDYKKVREYESRLLAQNENGDGNNMGSYWKLERHERKDKNLPTSLLLQIYEALVEVVERKGIGTGTTVVSYVLQNQPAVATVQLSLPHPPPLLQHYPSSDPTPTPSPPLPLQLPPPPPFSQSLPTLAQILIQVSIQRTHHQQRGEEKEKQAIQMKKMVHQQYQEVLLSLQMLCNLVNSRKREGIENF